MKFKYVIGDLKCKHGQTWLAFETIISSFLLYNPACRNNNNRVCALEETRITCKCDRNFRCTLFKYLTLFQNLYLPYLK